MFPISGNAQYINCIDSNSIDQYNERINDELLKYNQQNEVIRNYYLENLESIQKQIDQLAKKSDGNYFVYWLNWKNVKPYPIFDGKQITNMILRTTFENQDAVHNMDVLKIYDMELDVSRLIRIKEYPTEYDMNKYNQLKSEMVACQDYVRLNEQWLKKEQEEAAIRALTKKKLELELEMLSKQKLEQTAPVIQETSSSSSWSVANIDEMVSEFQLLKTTREKNAFIGKRIVALKRELRKAGKVRVKEIINEMRKLKELQK